MVNNVDPNRPAVGGCLQCRQLFLVTDSTSSCQFCGRPPDLLLPFGLAYYIEGAVQATLDTEKQEREEGAQPVGEEVELEPPAVPEEVSTPVVFDFTCPECGEEYQVLVTDSEILVVPPPAAPPADEAAATEAPLPAAAPQPEETPPAPAMAQDAFGEPAEGPPVSLPRVESTAGQSAAPVGEGQGAAAPGDAFEEPPV